MLGVADDDGDEVKCVTTVMVMRSSVLPQLPTLVRVARSDFDLGLLTWFE